jgi:protein tyrosine phosphatase (PTP) superfamily phosphohydrolase (DUF442 family)
MKILFPLVIAFSFTTTGFCSEKNQQTNPVETNVTVGAKLKANRYKNLYFAGQPEMNEFKQLKKEGFATIVNLRLTSEKMQEKEPSAVKATGMNYYNIPFDIKATLTDNFINKITTTVVKHRKEGKVLVHCSSGNRVAIWLGAHFLLDHAYDKEQAFKMAQTLGLNKEKSTKKLQDYLKTK